jgi:hypothetical protein
MKPLDLFRRAVAEIGDVSAEELSAHLEKQHGSKIELAFIRLFKATLRDLDRMTKLRQEAKHEQPAKRRRDGQGRVRHG